MSSDEDDVAVGEPNVGFDQSGGGHGEADSEEETRKRRKAEHWREEKAKDSRVILVFECSLYALGRPTLTQMESLRRTTYPLSAFREEQAPV